MEVNMSQTDVDAAQYTKSISYAEAKDDKEKVLELHKQVLWNGLPKHDKQHEKQGQDFEVVHSSSYKSLGKCSTTLNLELDDYNDDPDTECSATVALNVSAVISCYTKMYKKQQPNSYLEY